MRNTGDRPENEDAARASPPDHGFRRPGQTIVVSGPRDGSGRTAVVAHLAIMLLQTGREVGVLDLDFRHCDLTRWLRRRERRGDEQAEAYVIPAAPVASAAPCRDVPEAEATAAARWDRLLNSMARACETLIVDAPSGDGRLARRVHESADLVLTIVAESAPDLELLLEVDEAGERTGRPGPYARMAWEARRRRGQTGSPVFDWVLVRGRASPEAAAAYADGFAQAGRLIGARPGPRIVERSAWRLGMECGLTALDPGAASAAGREAVLGDLRALAAAAKIDQLEGPAPAL